MEIHNSFHLNFSKEKFQFFGWNSNTKIFQPKPKLFPLGNATAWCPGRWNSTSHALISLYAPWYSWFPFFQMKAAASLKLYFLIPDGTHSREMNGDLILKNNRKFPHYPFRLYRWKHSGFKERFQEKGFPGKQALFQGKLNWKPVISVNRQFQDSYFVSAGWTDPAVEHYSRFPYSLSAVSYSSQTSKAF